MERGSVTKGKGAILFLSGDVQKKALETGISLYRGLVGEHGAGVPFTGNLER